MRVPDNMYLVRGPDGLTDVLARLQHGPLAVDTETTGLRWWEHRVGSLNLAAGRTAIVAMGDALRPVLRYLSDQIKDHRTLVFHHAKFDMHMMRESFGLHIPYPVHDTMIQSHLLDQRGARGAGRWHGGHSLKPLAEVYVDPFAQDSEKDLLLAIKAAGGRTKGDWLLAPRRKFAKYSALDAWYTLQLHEQFIERITYWPDFDGHPSLLSLYRTECWLTLALRDMEERGMRVSVAYLEKWRSRLHRRLERQRTELAKIAGRAINWNSTPQLRQLLYGKRRQGGLGIPVDRLNEAGDAPSTDKTALVKMAHPIGAALLAYRKTNHAYTADAGGALKAVTEHGLIHCDFNQNVDTGRTSCKSPNLQGQDKKSGIRHGFRPRKGLVLRMADYSQMEMRFAAHFAGEPMMVKGFNTDPKFDVHFATAQLMFGLKRPSEEQRSHSKTMNFAMLYGAGEDAVTSQLMDRMTRREALRACMAMDSEPGIAESPHRVLARRLRERYRETMPTMPKTAKAEEQLSKALGFVMDAFGRHRWLDDGESYKAFNSKIQGSGGDQAQKGLVDTYRECQLSRGELALLLLVHDEIVYESEGDPRTDRRVLELMAETRRFRVPIVADMKGSAVSWQKKESITLAA